MFSLMNMWTLCTCGQLLGNRTHIVVASYRPSMLVSGVRFPVCALLCACIRHPDETELVDDVLRPSTVEESRLPSGPVA